MSSCRDIEPLLAAYVDGEAPDRDRDAVEAHAALCTPCREAIAGEEAARDVLSACRERLRMRAPGPLHARCAAHAAARPFRTWRTLVPLSVAATLLLAVAGAFIYSALSQVEALAAQAAADHVKCANVGIPAPGDPVASAARWEGAQQWPVRVAASEPALDLEFLTIRRCLVTGGRTAHLMYKWRGEPLSVYVLPTPVEAITKERLIERFGYETVLWSQHGRTYVIVAGRRADDMAPVVRYVQAHTQ